MVLRVLLLAGLVLLPGLSWADGKRDLDDGIAFYENLDTKRALYRLTEAAKAQDLGPQDRAIAYLYLGMLHFESGESEEAEAAWTEAVQLDRQVKAPKGTSPKTIAALEAVRKKTPERPPPPPVEVKPPPEEPGAPKTTEGDPANPGTSTITPRETKKESEPPKADPLAPQLKPNPPDPNDRKDENKLVTTAPPPQAEGVSPWVWVGVSGGVAAAAAAAVVVGILLTGGSGDCNGEPGGCLEVRVQ